MNTLTGNAPILPQKKSRILFDDKDIDFGFPVWQEKQIIELWNQNKSIVYIAKTVRRNPHEIFFALYEAQIDGKVSNIGRAFMQSSTLLVPGKEQLNK
ncbi:hypothetical protein [Virgibacillus oceani]|uniref:Uncharacterized protein n=1 Tax=Virgibacillus oceani TaxID=1479511 RepID=A0A917H1J2_9BACI|nr:hypothetical protein [Virgibacillus oceani]GGG64573.1 hypothetical protein GCM10011398_05220 [Virgibacillus oceani]